MAQHAFMSSGEAQGVKPESATAKECYPLRESVLRPNQPKENWTYVGDDDPNTIHLAVRDSGTIVGVVTLLPEPHPTLPNHKWRLRGMAVVPDHQKQGIGRELLQELQERIQGEGMWCTARRNIEGFYLQHGFVCEGEAFEMNKMPHVMMRTE